MAAAMKGGPVDRTPFMCQISVTHFYRALQLNKWSALWLDPDSFTRAGQDIAALYGMDGALINIYPQYDIWQSIKNIEHNDKRDIVTFADGSRATFTAEGDEIYDWKLPENKFNTTDFDPDKYNPPLPTEHWFDSLRAFDREFAATHSIHWEVQSPFDHLVDLFGMSEAMILTVTDPGKAMAILERSLEQEIARALGALETTTVPDAIKISSPYVGQSFLSPKSYSQLVVSMEKKLVAAIHDKKPEIPVYLHTCGALDDRLELALESGYDGIECLDPPPLGNVVLEDAMRRLEGSVFIKGNLDSVNLLGQGDRTEIEREVRKCLDLGKNYGGGYILSTACSTAPSVAPDTMKFVRELVEKYG